MWTPYEMAVMCGGTDTPVDQVVAFRDDFESGASDVEDRGWLWYQENLATGQAITGGEVDMQIDTGGAAGSFWFDANDGLLLYRTISGDVDVRARVRVTDAAGTGLPDPTQFRIAALAAHDPDRSSALNYVHVGGGSTAQTGNRVEWKTTADSTSTYGDNGSDLVALDLDLRIVRTGQSFALSYRASDGALSDDTGWTTVQTVDRSATPMPTALQYGIVLYSNDETPGVRVFIDETWATR